jgi:hypothetical protein
MSEDIKKIQFKITPILKKHQVKKSSIFGSFARGENNKNSDIDLLIEFKGKKSLFDMAGLKIDLEKKLKKRVDLLTYKAIHPYILDNVNKDAVKIYG